MTQKSKHLHLQCFYLSVQYLPICFSSSMCSHCYISLWLLSSTHKQHFCPPSYSSAQNSVPDLWKLFPLVSHSHLASKVALILLLDWLLNTGFNISSESNPCICICILYNSTLNHRQYPSSSYVCDFPITH